MLLIKFLLYFQRKRCILCDNALRRVHIEFSMIYFKDNQNGISANVCGISPLGGVGFALLIQLHFCIFSKKAMHFVSELDCHSYCAFCVED